MDVVILKEHKVLLSTDFLARLDKGLEVIRFDVRYPEVQRLAQIMFTVWVMLTIGSTGDDTRYTKGLIDGDNETQDFVYSLGYCQLYAFFELK